MSGELGGCLVGSHPQLNTENQVLYTEGIELIEKSTNLIQSHPGFKIPHSFIQGEEMGTNPKNKCRAHSIPLKVIVYTLRVRLLVFIYKYKLSIQNIP